MSANFTCNAEYLKYAQVNRKPNKGEIVLKTPLYMNADMEKECYVSKYDLGSVVS